ncbi:putative glycosyltransferase EpsJ [Lacunisphaera limnophila]|uniref:Putative glycosyltransferase EpsJ n=1 Tax=Lacunisphaera limnophila TaxID=1838286 RepID=A0A1D8AYC2_9BACT|nr:glycosyltransferase [Lacunisphaera limnophila]AOS45890.1 putative glycosyltransferase EpsJ [Lacunisphaera limnophila]
MSPHITVCLPNLNAGEYIEERINSISAQTFGNYEVIINDGYSNDGSFEELTKYAKRDKRVRILQSPPLGIYDGWNRCILESTGKWIYIATSDDTMHPRCLEMLNQSASKNIEVVTSKPWQIDEFGESSILDIEFIRRLSARRRIASGLIDTRREFRAGLWQSTPSMSLTQMLIRRDVFDKAGFFPEDLGGFGDYLWQMRMLQRCQVYYVARKLGSWRRHDKQSTTSRREDLLLARAQIAQRIFSEGCNYLDEVTQRAFAYCLYTAGILSVNISLAEAAEYLAVLVKRRSLAKKIVTRIELFTELRIL